MPAQTVNFGPYFGFTLAELVTDGYDGTVAPNQTLCELSRYKAAVKQSYSRLTGSTIDGQSFSFGTREDGSLRDWQTDLQAAIYYLDPGKFPFDVPTNVGAIVSR